MFTRTRKPLIVFAAALLCHLAGMGGRVEAGFQVGHPDEVSERATRGLLDDLAPSQGPEASGRAADPLVPVPERSPGPRGLPFGPAQASQTTGGTTSSSGVPSGDTSGGGVFALLPPDLLLTAKALRGARFLADQRFQPDAFPSRLYRPPRACG